VHKVTVDAGFSCPNRDGSLSKDGCIYCSNEGFSVNTRQKRLPVKEQIAKGIAVMRKRLNAEKFVVYFQAFSNTHAAVDQLRQTYDAIKDFKEVVGLSIATRPDCVDEEKLDLIQSYAKSYDVWIEYGLQSIHNSTLRAINRGHSYEDFLKAVMLTRKRKGIKICAHVIIGLPGETEEMMMDTAKALGTLKVEGVKIHPLHVVKGTKLEQMYRRKEFDVLTRHDYVHYAVHFLEYLWPQTVIQRITADCPPDLLVAPMWLLEKQRLLSEIHEYMEQKQVVQGLRWK
jgi:uncharacterized protein